MYVGRKSMVLGAALAGILALAGCSSSSKPGGSSSAASTTAASSAGSSSSSASTAPAGDPIVIGNVGTYSGPIGTSNTAAVPVLKAWADQVNAAGGINGHMIKIVSADDKTSPSDNLTAVQDQVENQHAIAFVSNMVEATAGAAQTYLEGKQIPVVGGDGNLPTWYQSPMYFPTGAAPNVGNYAQLKTAQDAGAKKLSIWYCTDSPTCKIFADQQKKVADTISLATTGFQPISLAQPSFTAPCLAAKNAGADYVTPNVDAGTFQRIVKSCQSVGYNPVYTTSTNSINAGYSALPSGAKTLGVTGQFPFFLTTGSPAIDAYATIAKGLTTDQQNSGASQAWAAVSLFELAAKAGVKAGGTPTSADILAGLYTVQKNTLGGVTIPLTFTKGQPAPLGNCWFTVKFEDGKFTSPSGLTPVCTDATIPN